MTYLKDKLEQRFKNDQDFTCITTFYLGPIPVTLVGYSTLIHFPDTLKLLALQAQHLTEKDEETLCFLASLGTVIESKNAEQQAAKAIVTGSLILLHEPSGMCVDIRSVIPQTLTRSIETPSTENVLRGTISSFNENIDTNIGMIRKQLIDERLQIKSFRCGQQKSTRLEVLYVKDKVSSDLLNRLLKQIEANQDTDTPNIRQLGLMLGFRKWEFTAKFHSTELPQSTAAALKNGKVVILLDRFPFALILPSLLSDMYVMEDDNNFQYPFILFLRMIRITGILITLLIPGLYVALVSVNPEVLRIELALSIAKSRVDVPYPALIETLLLLIILELILEASVRLPKSIGPTLTMVGGIILGEAIVSAKLVSNLLIIILAATTIACSTVAGYQNSLTLRLMKYAVLFLCSFFGIMGLVAGLVVISTYVAKTETFGIPYFQLKPPKDENSG
ncbi:hypothetical protein AWM70_09045 [Paenibacillus yonginensis]|uniref:Uncharacterized protein n=1 Tax=Paenibacillus yonginensis TaxID=1462996 RepID=A0A1B1MZX7_9BACL|nr:spore germination protein [Paenibacillus yonginensis]ANS74718.1 hypothetical protein AWM70_09045 [Paenibacillus yonginensis]